MSDDRLSQVLKALIHKDYDSDVVETIAGVGNGNFFITSTGSTRADRFTVLYQKSIVTLIVRGSRHKSLKADMIQLMKQMLTKF